MTSRMGLERRVLAGLLPFATAVLGAAVASVVGWVDLMQVAQFDRQAKA